MPYLPDSLPFPEPDMDAAEFWEHCRERRLMFQACGDCGVAQHPPLPVCAACQSTNRTWVPAPTEARVFSYTFAHHASYPAVRDRLPYNVAVIAFPALPGVKLISNVIGAEPGALSVDAEVELVWDEGPGGQWLPRFRLFDPP